jgi:nucleolar protein 14
MEELIAKSKYYKGLKKKEKEEDADALDALDATFRELSSKGEFRTGGQRMERPAVREKPDDYDRNVRELAQDIRATPGQRAQTAEEVAAAAAERLEELERQRVKRMRAGGGDDDDDDVDGPKGGFAARRAKVWPPCLHLHQSPTFRLSVPPSASRFRRARRIFSVIYRS